MVCSGSPSSRDMNNVCIYQFQSLYVLNIVFEGAWNHNRSNSLILKMHKLRPRAWIALSKVTGSTNLVGKYTLRKQSEDLRNPYRALWSRKICCPLQRLHFTLLGHWGRVETTAVSGSSLERVFHSITMNTFPIWVTGYYFPIFWRKKDIVCLESNFN